MPHLSFADVGDKAPVTKAFVYTEVQNSVPFGQIPWEKRNPVISSQAGFISKTWLSGLGNNSVGGIYAFDSIENAKHFAIDIFPKTAAKMNAATYTRIFDASVVEEAGRAMHSPFFQ